MSLDLDGRDRCFVIAEAGTCHADESPGARRTLAYAYLREAKRSGADAVKFQMFNDPIRDDMFCWIEGDEEREPRWRESHMPLAAWKNVKTLADELGIMFLASVFQHSTVKWLNELEVEATKVASRAAETFPYDDAPGPFLISLGMSSAGVRSHHRKSTYLQCEPNYPSTARWHFDDELLYGFSDHSGTPWRAIDAIARGCELVEVHFYIDPIDAGPDLPASLDLDQLKLVCEARDAFAELRGIT